MNNAYLLNKKVFSNKKIDSVESMEFPGFPPSLWSNGSVHGKGERIMVVGNILAGGYHD